MEMRAYIILFIIIIICSTASAIPAVQRNKHHEPVIPSHKYDVKPTPTAPTVLLSNKPRGPAVSSHKHDVKPTPTAPKVLLGQPPSIYHCPPIC
ncbi:hypothetical protein C2G38_377466 [Gigaspora rosea]|uniref:Uncharacterized protein n=1 Tax=Gigaspora rosea TaxID=44941 RepID=A0A397VY46_9GLOM|nr:hypothetical protein C2G38_377466 [Gigaspora rosea]